MWSTLVLNGLKQRKECEVLSLLWITSDVNWVKAESVPNKKKAFNSISIYYKNQSFVDIHTVQI